MFELLSSDLGGAAFIFSFLIFSSCSISSSDISLIVYLSSITSQTVISRNSRYFFSIRETPIRPLDTNKVIILSSTEYISSGLINVLKEISCISYSSLNILRILSQLLINSSIIIAFLAVLE